MKKQKKEVAGRGSEEEKTAGLYLPHTPKETFIKYLLTGHKQLSTYKEGDIPTVSVNRVRQYLLECGFTELALARVFFGSHTDLKRSVRYPQKKDEKLMFTISDANPYEIEAGWYDAVEILRFLVPLIQPDMPAEEDNLRARVLAEIQGVKELKEALLERGERFIALSETSWSFTLRGDVMFPFNPGRRPGIESGYYTLDDLRRWYEGDTTSPVFSQGGKEKTAIDSDFDFDASDERNIFKRDYLRVLTFFSSKQHYDARMLKILLMGCPFPDLVKRFSKKLA